MAQPVLSEQYSVLSSIKYGHTSMVVSPFLPGKFPHCVKANKPILLLGPENSESKRLLGREYPFWASAEDIDKIAFCITELYKNWKDNSGELKLDRADLEDYFSITYLRKTILNILE